VSDETPLELEERHIALFETLITKQEALVAALEQRGNATTLERAREILTEMRGLLQFAWERRASLLKC